MSALVTCNALDVCWTPDTGTMLIAGTRAQWHRTARPRRSLLRGRP